MVRIWCDFNGGIDEDTFGLNYVGSKRDIEEQGIELRPGLDVTLTWKTSSWTVGRPSCLWMP